MKHIPVLLAGAAFIALGGSANAAVTVIGPGPAQLCFTGADEGGDPLMYTVYCNQALAGSLSDSDRAATFVNRGVLRLAEGTSEAARADFDAGLAINPQLGEGYVDRAAALIREKRYTDALADIDKGLSLGAKRPEVAYYDRAVCDESMGDIQTAYKDYKQALTAQPSFTPASEQLKRFKIVTRDSNGT